MSGKKRHIDFIITTNDGSEAAAAANKKRVRSVAAAKSWPERRKKTLEHLESSGGQTTFLVQPPDEPSTVVRRHATKQRASGVSTPATETSLGMPGASSAPSPAAASDAFSDASTWTTSSIPPRSPLHVIPHDGITSSPCQCWQCDMRRTLAAPPAGGEMLSPQAGLALRAKWTGQGLEKPILFSGELALIFPPVSRPGSPCPSLSPARVDPFNGYPVPFQPWFDSILHHMMTIYAPRGWSTMRVRHEQGLAWEWFMHQHALSDGALFYVRLLYGSGDLVRLGTLRPDIMVWLRTQAVRAINEALDDPKRAVSDPLILAVGRIALHESLYGDKQAANLIHRPAQKRMIAMRGGMKMLDYPRLVKRLMRWSDRVMAMQSDTPRFLEDDDELEEFTLSQSVELLERWVPPEGESLRSRLQIADPVKEESVS